MTTYDEKTLECCVDDAVGLAARANVKNLFLFHHDPDHADAKITAMVEHAQRLAAEQRAGLTVEAAREGRVIQIATLAGRRK